MNFLLPFSKWFPFPDSHHPFHPSNPHPTLREKFPDELQGDNFSGQLWFATECLAAGSNVPSHIAESEELRPHGMLPRGYHGNHSRCHGNRSSEVVIRIHALCNPSLLPQNSFQFWCACLDELPSPSSPSPVASHIIQRSNNPLCVSLWALSGNKGSWVAERGWERVRGKGERWLDMNARGFAM